MSKHSKRRREKENHRPRKRVYPGETMVNFYGQLFKINSDVLTPRPETEELIDCALTLAGRPTLPGVKAPRSVLPTVPLILDVGTGSGCIAITLRNYLPEAIIYGLDVSKEAITMAAKNAGYHHASLHLRVSNLVDKYTRRQQPDLIVANLPYVDPNWKWVDKEALKDDPDIALYAEDGGLALIKQLLLDIVGRGWDDLYVVLEADPCQHEELLIYATVHGFRLVKDGNFAIVLTR